MNVKPFAGDRKPGVYRDWKKDVQVTQMPYQVPDDQMASLVYLVLTGDAKMVVSQTLEIEDLKAEDALMKIFKLLDREYMKAPHELADVAYRRFETTRRRQAQPMEEYLMELKQAKALLQREDPGSDISEISMARRMLRRAGLTITEQRLVLSAAGAKWELDPIESALRLMYHDVHLDNRKRHSAKPYFKGKSNGKGKPAPAKGTFATESTEEDEGDEEEDWGEDDETPESNDMLYNIDEEGDEDDEDYEDDEMDELLAVYYQGIQAKKKLLGKGKGKMRTTGPKKKTGQCRDCKGHGHWSGDAECPRVQDGTVPPFKPKEITKAVQFVSSSSGHEAPEVRVYGTPCSNAKVDLNPVTSTTRDKFLSYTLPTKDDTKTKTITVSFQNFEFVFAA